MCCVFILQSVYTGIASFLLLWCWFCCSAYVLPVCFWKRGVGGGADYLREGCFIRWLMICSNDCETAWGLLCTISTGVVWGLLKWQYEIIIHRVISRSLGPLWKRCFTTCCVKNVKQSIPAVEYFDRSVPVMLKIKQQQKTAVPIVAALSNIFSQRSDKVVFKL